LGVGYSIFGMVVLIATGVINVRPKELVQIIADLEQNNKSLTPECWMKNKAKKIAKVIFWPHAYYGWCRALSRQYDGLSQPALCRNLKNFAQYSILPDMNHFADGRLSSSQKQQIRYFVSLLIQSLLVMLGAPWHPTTKAVVKKNGIKVIVTNEPPRPKSAKLSRCSNLVK
jgi:hypothetical protein